MSLLSSGNFCYCHNLSEVENGFAVTSGSSLGTCEFIPLAWVDLRTSSLLSAFAPASPTGLRELALLKANITEVWGKVVVEHLGFICILCHLLPCLVQQGGHIFPGFSFAAGVLVETLLLPFMSLTRLSLKWALAFLMPFPPTQCLYLSNRSPVPHRWGSPTPAERESLLICGATAWLRLSQFSHFTGHSSQSRICYKGIEPNPSLSFASTGRAWAAVLVFPAFVIMGVSISHVDKLRLWLLSLLQLGLAVLEAARSWSISSQSHDFWCCAIPSLPPIAPLTWQRRFLTTLQLL